MAEKSIRLVITPSELSAVVSAMDAQVHALPVAGLRYLNYLKGKQFELNLGTVAPAYVKKDSVSDLGFGSSTPSDSIVNTENVMEYFNKAQENPQHPDLANLTPNDWIEINAFAEIMGASPFPNTVKES